MKTFNEFLNEHEELDKSFASTLGAIGICIACLFGVTRCNNAIATKGLKDLGQNTIENFQDFNQEGWGRKVFLGGDARMKAAYGAVIELAREKGISCYDAAREIKGNFGENMKARFGGVNNMLNMHPIKNVSKTQMDGEDCVIITIEISDSETKEYVDIVIPEFEAQAPAQLQ